MAVSRETIRPIVDDVFAVEISGEVDVRALLLFGADFTLLIDTLTRPSDLDEALESAKQGFAVWRATSAYDRCKIMHKAADLMRERADTIARTDTGRISRPPAMVPIRRRMNVPAWMRALAATISSVRR